MKKTIFLDKEIEVLVVSAGGVGTTFLIEAIAQFNITNCSSNTDGYKHLPIPPISLGKAPKIIYVFGDPVMASISLFRRKYQRTQSVEQNKYRAKKKTLSLNLSLKAYAERGIDDLGIVYHFYNWYEKYRFQDVFFIHYEHLYDYLEELRQFLELPISFVEQFPEKRERNSSRETVSAGVLENLDKIYRTYKLQLEHIKNCFIRPKENIFHTIPKSLSTPYRIAYKRALKRVLKK